MKSCLTVFFFACAFLPSHAWANSKKISEHAQALSKLAYKLESNSVKGSDADAMLRDFALRIKGIEAQELVIANYPKRTLGVDEGSAVYGLMKLNDAATMMMLVTKSNDENIDTDAMWALLRALKNEGAKFAYTSDGGSICGVQWPSVLILDESAKVIHEIVLIGGSC